MATLQSKTTHQILVPHLEVADGFYSRGKGLLGRQTLGEGEGLWIHRCNSIHTYFMKFAIDCVFVDKSLKIKALYADVKPWRLVWPVWGARSVMELPAGSIERLGLSVGDELHVGT